VITVPWYTFVCPVCKSEKTTYRQPSYPEPVFCSAKCANKGRVYKFPDLPFTKEKLVELYCDRRMTTRRIAKKLGITRRKVEYWMRKWGIEARSAIETRYPDRPKPPTKEILYNLYWVRYLSYVEIANIYQVDQKSVSYWLDKYGIPKRTNWETRRNGNNPREPTKKELKKLYCDRGLSLDEVGNIFGMSGHAIQIRMRKFDLPIRLPGYNQIRYIADDGHEVYSRFELHVDNWLTKHGIDHTYEPSLPFGGMADFLIGDTYIEIWGIEHNETYKNRTKEKKHLYKKHQLKLVGLYPKDIPDKLNKKLGHLTRQQFP
jgi:hypothetical protein